MSAQNEQQVKSPKDQLHELMVEMFAMIEDLNTNEGQYLQFAEMFKQMNLNVNRLAEMKTAIQSNYYYIHYVRQNTRTTLRRKRLTEAQKAKHPDYLQCNCGRYIHNDEYTNHLQTQVHYQGRRNRKYSAGVGKTEDQMRTEIGREILLQDFIIKHLVKTKGIQVDNEAHDEVGV